MSVDKIIQKKITHLTSQVKRLAELSAVNTTVTAVVLKRKKREDLTPAINHLTRYIEREMDNTEAQIENIAEEIQAADPTLKKSPIITDLSGV